MLVEVCANSLQSALHAQQAGADRIELCSELGVGGITPSYGLLQEVKESIHIPVRVLIRPRSGNFTYSEAELRIMLADIALCRDMGFEGVVSGVLRSDQSLDLKRTQNLIEATRPLSFTFHRAFDWVSDPETTLLQLHDLGVDDLLSSGQSASALDGMELLMRLLRTSSTPTIMPGGGINVKNALAFKTAGFKAIHLSGTRFIEALSQPPSIPMLSPKHLREEVIAQSDAGLIAEIVKRVK